MISLTSARLLLVMVMVILKFHIFAYRRNAIFTLHQLLATCRSGSIFISAEPSWPCMLTLLFRTWSFCRREAPWSL